MLPDLTYFTEHMFNKGVGLDTPVVCYDIADKRWAGRACWLLKLHGHEQVWVLGDSVTNMLKEGKKDSKIVITKGHEAMDFAFT